MDWRSLLLSPHGRVGRTGFWIGFFVLFGLGFMVQFIPLVGQLLAFAMIWSWICLFTKRFHDLGQSGWWQLLPFGLWMLTFIVGLFVLGAAAFAAAFAYAGSWDTTAWLSLGSAGLGFGVVAAAAALSHLLMILFLGVAPSQSSTNRYGHPPGSNLAAPF
jgi:uncharacterized membrane protein YhaH (DUF805 family)